jgi:hypothetical protein
MYVLCDCISDTNNSADHNFMIINQLLLQVHGLEGMQLMKWASDDVKGLYILRMIVSCTISPLKILIDWFIWVGINVCSGCVKYWYLAHSKVISVKVQKLAHLLQQLQFYVWPDIVICHDDINIIICTISDSDGYQVFMYNNLCRDPIQYVPCSCIIRFRWKWCTKSQ